MNYQAAAAAAEAAEATPPVWLHVIGGQMSQHSGNHLSA
jgi:hypothetical protein